MVAKKSGPRPMSATAAAPLPEPAAPAAEHPTPEPAARRRGRRLPPASGRTVRVTVDLPSSDRRGIGRVSDLLGDELNVHVPVGQVMAALAHLVAADGPEATKLRTSVSQYLRSRVVE